MRKMEEGEKEDGGRGRQAAGRKVGEARKLMGEVGEKCREQSEGRVNVMRV